MDDLVMKRKNEISFLAQKFCEEKLNEEYWQLCDKMILKLSRKRNIPFLYGKIEIWAAAIIWCIARVNFLFDKANKYYMTGGDICNYFNTNKSTVGQKSALIEKTLKIGVFDKNFCTRKLQDENPLRDLIMVDGFIVPKDMLEE